MPKTAREEKGVSLIEVMVSVVIIAILFLGIYTLIILALRISADNKAYVAAIEIANQQMEEIRNLPYIDVGTASGSPSGVLPDYKTVQREGYYTVHNTVMFYDDPYDGTVASGTDSIFVDYKIATVEVTWHSQAGEKKVTLFSKIIPRTEETLAGYGLLKLKVVDADGDAVQNADIHIENDDEGISVDLLSDANGMLYYPVPPGFENYEVTVTKAGHGIDRTYDRTADNPNPTKPHLSVAEGDKTEEAFSIDLLARLRIRTITQDLPDNWVVNTDSSMEGQSNARLAFDNSGFMYVVWQDYRDSSDAKIYAQKYDSTGNQQWTDDVRIGSANRQILPDIDVDSSGALYLCWNDDSTGNQDTYIDKRLPADGDPDPSWGGELKVNTLADPDDQNHARMVISEPSGSAVTNIVWQDDRDSAWDVYLQQYDSSKNALQTPEIRVNTNPIASGTDQYAPTLDVDSENDLVVAWSDSRNGNIDIFAAKLASTSAGHLWEKRMNEYASGTDQYSPALGIGPNDFIYLA
jgi:prepilin-type N-terminal cleavage/methylation domain-containing protein